MMQLKNTTDFSDRFLRRMVLWCCREVGLPKTWLNKATFRNTRAAFSGLGGGRGIVVRIGPPSSYPVRSFPRRGTNHPYLEDRLEGLVSTTAHEIFHCWQSYAKAWDNYSKGRDHCESAAISAETLVLKTFRLRREELLERWNKPTLQKAATIAPPPLEKRIAKTEADLARWVRKFKMAATKIKKLNRRLKAQMKQRNTVSC